MSARRRNPYAALPWIITWVMAPLPLYILAVVAVVI